MAVELDIYNIPVIPLTKHNRVCVYLSRYNNVITVLYRSTYRYMTSHNIRTTRVNYNNKFPKTAAANYLLFIMLAYRVISNLYFEIIIDLKRKP